MKRLTAILLALVMLLSLAACGKKDKDPDSSGVQAQEPEIPGTPSSGGSANYDPSAPDAADFVSPTEPEPASASTENPTDAAKPDTGISVSHKDVSLFYAGETFTLRVGGISGIYACTFTSKSPEIASVDETTGVVTAVAPGITTINIHVEYEGQYDFECIVRCRWTEEASLPDSGTEPNTEAPTAPAADPSTSLSDFYATLQGKYTGLSGMMVLDGQLLDSYYPGLSGIAAVKEILICESAISINNKAVGLVRLSDDASMNDVLQVQGILQSRITAQAEGGAFYPDACDTWESGVITSVSNCVGMFVYPDDAHSMASLFTDTFSN